MAEPLDRGMPSGAPEDRERFPGARLLDGKSPSEVLNRLVDGDPLGIEARARESLREGAWFLNPERVWLRAAARTAYAAIGYEGKPPLDAWLRARVREAIHDLSREQVTEELQRLPVQASRDFGYYAELATRLKTEVHLGRVSALALNALARDERLAFLAVAVEGKTVDRYVAEGNGPTEHVRAMLARAGRAVLLAAETHRRENEGGRHGS